MKRLWATSVSLRPKLLAPKAAIQAIGRATLWSATSAHARHIIMQITTT